MKLRFSLSLRHALLVCLSLLATNSLLHADTVNLTDSPLTWSTEGAPNYSYSSSSMKGYLADNITWNVVDGSYYFRNLCYTVSLDNSTQLENRGRLIAEASSSGTAGANDCHSAGFLLQNSATLTNYSTVSATASAYFYSHEIGRASAIKLLTQSTLVNKEGASLTGIGYAYASTGGPQFAYASGLTIDSSSVINEKNAQITARVDTQKPGVNGGFYGAGGSTGIWLLNDGSLLNSGTIIANAQTLSYSNQRGYGTYGLSLSGNSELTNDINGVVTAIAGAESTLSPAIGILLSDSSVFLNEGTVSAMATAPDTGTNPYGISLTKQSTLYNSGILNVDTIDISRGGSTGNLPSFYLLNGGTVKGYTAGTTTMVTGSMGTLYLGGTRSAAGTVDAVALGSKIIVDSALSIAGVSLNLIDEVALKMSGDLAIASDVSTTWNDHGLTVDNGTSVRTVTVGDSFSAAWNTSFTMTPDASGTGILLTQKGTGQNVTLRDGDVTLRDGNLKASRQLTIGGGEKSSTLTSATDTLNISSQMLATITNTTMHSKNLILSAAGGVLLDNSTLSIDGGTGSLTNISVSADSTITSASKADLTLSNVTIVFGTENSAPSASVVSLLTVEDPLTKTSVSPNTYYLDCTSLANVNVSGDLTLDLSYWAEDFDAGSYDSLVLTFADTVNFTNNATAQMTLNGTDYITASSATGNVILFNLNEGSESIPEPTTATLSLLALTGLVLRRRRK